MLPFQARDADVLAHGTMASPAGTSAPPRTHPEVRRAEPQRRDRLAPSFLPREATPAGVGGECNADNQRTAVYVICYIRLCASEIQAAV